MPMIDPQTQRQFEVITHRGRVCNVYMHMDYYNLHIGKHK